MYFFRILLFITMTLSASYSIRESIPSNYGIGYRIIPSSVRGFILGIFDIFPWVFFSYNDGSFPFIISWKIEPDFNYLLFLLTPAIQCNFRTHLGKMDSDKHC